MTYLRKILCAVLATFMMLTGTSCGGLGDILFKEGIGDEGKQGSLGLEYVSNGDGTCHVSVIGTCMETDIVIPGKHNEEVVTSIGTGAFSGCSSLTSVIIPDSVTNIGERAFSLCSSLTSIVIPDNVTNIGNSAFSGCSGLTEITVEEGNPTYHSDGNCLIETESKILVAGCQTSIIPTDGSVTSIGQHAFSSCDRLTSIVIPDNVTNIGDYAFSGCSGLTSTVIPDSVTSIGTGAFSCCDRLTSIVIPDSVTSIGTGAFSDCSSLTSVVILDSVPSIGEWAFSGCSGLTSVVIPASVTSIGGLAFSQCRDLSDIYFTGTESEWNAISKGSAWDDGTGSYTVHFNYVP